MQKLKEIKDQIIKHKLEYIPASGISPKESRDKRQIQDEDIEKLHTLFDIYRIRAGELRSLMSIWTLAILYFFVATIYLYLSSIGRILDYANFILITHLAFQLLFLWLAIKIFAIDPDKLQQAGYLVKNLGLHPHALVSALDLNLYIQRGKELFEKFDRNDPLEINLNIRLRAFGFRFLYMVSGKDKTIYYVAYGPVTERNSIRYLLPDVFDNEEYNKIKLGSFKFNLIGAQEVEETLFIFLPFFKDEQLSPMVQTRKITVPLGSIFGGTWSINTMRVYKDIQYSGEGLSLKYVKYSGNDPIMKQILAKFSKDIKSKKIIEISNTEGKLFKKDKT